MKLTTVIFVCMALLFTQCGPERTQKTGQSQKAPRGGPALVEQGQKDFEALYVAKMEWLQGPYNGRERENQFQVSFFDKAGNPVQVDDFDFRIYMGMHGHGGRDRNRVIGRMPPNSFLGQNFYFTMPDMWEINMLVTIKGIRYAVEKKVKVPG